MGDLVSNNDALVSSKREKKRRKKFLARARARESLSHRFRFVGGGRWCHNTYKRNDYAPHLLYSNATLSSPFRKRERARVPISRVLPNCIILTNILLLFHSPLRLLYDGLISAHGSSYRKKQISRSKNSV